LEGGSEKWEISGRISHDEGEETHIKAWGEKRPKFLKNLGRESFA